jgi:hypothetical protein
MFDSPRANGGGRPIALEPSEHLSGGRESSLNQDEFRFERWRK